MKHKLFPPYQNVIQVILLVVVSALGYLPRLNQIGYLNDDWYLMYSAHAYGADVFVDIFSSDRPMRALVMIPAYNLFGDNVLYYNLSAYLFHLISGLMFLWLLQMLWPRQRTATFLAALLFLIYPGFLSQINGIDYQSQMTSLASAMLSIALSVRSASIQKPLGKWAVLAFAVVLGWFYLGLVEYFIGLELLRFGSLYLLGSRGQDPWKVKFIAGIKHSLPSLVILFTFLVWRVFFFESVRGATDIGAQLEQFRESPLITIIWWSMRLFTNSLSVIFFAWGIPFYQFVGYIGRLPDLLLAVLATIAIVMPLFLTIRYSADEQVSENGDWRIEALWLGVATAVAGLIPVILVNRQADFSGYSRYTLASSPGSALILISILFFLSHQALRSGVLALLITVSVFTHHANAIRVVNQTKSLRAFWWQVAWRIPQLKAGTTLIANYPVVSIEEDYFVWGPANLIYYPDGIAGEKIRPEISAAVLNKDSMLRILTDSEKVQDNRRSIYTVIDYQNVLVLSMPTEGSCVQVIDGIQPEISPYEEERMMLIAPHSDPALIDLDAEPHLPPEIVFGPEPPHEWCYYYEKADLARQRGDWDEVLALGRDVRRKDLVPQDTIEWTPFLQAYAQAGDIEHLEKIRRLMKKSDPYVVSQICQSLREMPDLSAQVDDFIELFCAN